jgi:hypothetical protein
MARSDAPLSFRRALALEEARVCLAGRAAEELFENAPRFGRKANANKLGDDDERSDSEVFSLIGMDDDVDTAVEMVRLAYPRAHLNVTARCHWVMTPRACTSADGMASLTAALSLSLSPTWRKGQALALGRAPHAVQAQEPPHNGRHAQLRRLRTHSPAER